MAGSGEVKIIVKGQMKWKNVDTPGEEWVALGEVEGLEWNVDLSDIHVEAETLSGQLSKVAGNAEKAAKSFEVFNEAFKELQKAAPALDGGLLSRESYRLPGVKVIVESPCLKGGYLEKVLNSNSCCEEVVVYPATEMVKGDWGREGSIHDQIMHLNDYHRLTRGEIADWLETLDIDLSF